ncbi:fibronectin type III [Cellulomonas denverensis]|nr:fibronectin type III [Cellulomonas denverensis]
MVAAVLAVGAGVGAVLSPGYDTQEVATTETAVWVTRDDGQYARFHTDVGQIDTVRRVTEPTRVIQHGADAAVVAQGGRSLWPVDAGNPVDLVPEQDGTATAGTSTAEGTTEVVAGGDVLAQLTDTGQVWTQRLADAGHRSPVRLYPEPVAEEDDPQESAPAGAVAVDPDGLVAVYVPGDGVVRLLDAETGLAVADPEPVPQAPASAEVQLTVVEGRWVLVDPTAGRLWWSGGDGPHPVDLADDAQLQRATAQGGPVYLADRDGLVAVDHADGSSRRVVEATGTPAQPVVLDDGTALAAWLTTTGGTLWVSTQDQPRALTVPSDTLDQAAQVRPVLSDNGARAVLSESGSGLLWTVPDGQVVPVEQWAPLDRSTTETGTRQVEEVVEQHPPVAAPDTFGVRAGADVRLPVLLNDHDPNVGDVLTIVPESLAEGLAPGEFGTIRLAENDQLVVAQVSATTGSATFSYRVTDGFAVSEPATVTLQVVDEETSTPPQWCAVQGCTQTWPTATLSPGGTARVRVLDAWVDAEGDPLVLAGAQVDDPAVPVRVVAAADGTVTVQHTDPNAGPLTTSVTTTVVDARGETATRGLTVAVSASPALELEPIALVATPGVATVVHLPDHVLSGSGSVQVQDAVAATASAADLVIDVNARAGSVSITARSTGQFLLTYRLRDLVTGQEQSAQIRVICPEAASELTLAPMTAVVRARQDSTVDVLDAVRGVSDRVVQISSATSSDPALGVDVVDGAMLRLRGSTQDGRPGPVGTVRVAVTDGANAHAEGTVTVFLAEEPTGQPPIAVPDAAVVRAGEQVDVEVLANDVAPGGAELTLLPEVAGSDAEGELVFAAGDVLRYLAPSEPGTYRVDYGVALATDPSALATAAVTLTVVAEDTNRPPVPTTLVARVVAGATVEIPFDGRQIDPDGDPVAVIGVDQPDAGTGFARVNEIADAIVYQAPATARAGDQVRFGYTVRDARGATATAEVRIAVLDGSGPLAPIAYADRVRVEAGLSTPIRIEPLVNDLDPAGGTLSVVGLRPDAPAGSGEERRLSGLLDPATSLSDGTVQLRPGDQLGTHAYWYTVRSSTTGSTAEGLIVLDVIAAATAEPPLVTDTVLTARQRTELPGVGIDVLAGKVSWPTGAPGTLRVEVWGPAASRYSVVDGTRIAGPLPTEGALVPFAITGADHAGRTARTYAFLRIPPFDDMRVAARTDVAPVPVAEGDTVSADLSGRVHLAPGDRIEVRTAAAVRGNRPQASCAVEQGTLRYIAGNGAPWTDTCPVAVRLAGQETWTDLLVPIQVTPRSPQAVLTALSRTVSPGSSDTIDLMTLVSWEGGRVGDESALAFRIGATGSAFTVDQRGRTLTVAASVGAVPGTRVSLPIRVDAYGGLSTTVELVVGQTSPDTPRGATVTSSCDVSRGPNCTVTLVGVAGEHDPFAGRPGGGLRVERIGSSTGAVSCPAAEVRLRDATSVQVTWPAEPKPAGGSCTVPFTVADAQGRVGTGVLHLDVRGYPAAPGSVELRDFSAGSVTLDVHLATAATAHPAVSSVGIYEDGRAVAASCAAAGPGRFRCTVAGLSNGEQHAYTARSRNPVGESDDSTPVRAWAYQAPSISVSAAPVFDGGRTTAAQGVARVTLTSGSDVSAFEIEGRPEPVTRTGDTTTVDLVLGVGTHTVQVTPVSRFAPPIGAQDSRGAAGQTQVTVAGLPKVEPGTAQVQGRSIVVGGAGVDANGSTRPTELVYLLADHAGLTCRSGPSGELVVQGTPLRRQTSGTFSDLANDTQYWVTVCGGNGFGAVAANPPGELIVFQADPPTVNRGYSINARATVRGATSEFTRVTEPRVSAASGLHLWYSTDGVTWSQTFALPSDRVPDQVLVRQCSRSDAARCSAPAPVPAQEGSARAPVIVTTTAGTCSATEPPFTLSSGPLTGRASADPAIVGDQVTWTLNWVAGGPYDGLEPVRAATCTLPAPEPEPEPGPQEPAGES